MLAAVELVEKGQSIRKLVAMHGLNDKTLSGYVKVKSSSDSLDNASFGYIKERQVFSESIETEIVQHVLLTSCTNISWVNSYRASTSVI